MSSITIQAPAKINLFLKVLGRRPDGYHEIESLMLPISVYDRIVLESAPAGIKLWCDHPQLQVAEQNLAHRAAEAMSAYTSSALGVNIKLYKHIPLAAGLGGGSSDAAAVLKGLNSIWNLNLDQEQLLRLAEQLGADVPFFILGRPALARGRGEELHPVTVNPIWLVLVNPGFGVSTADVYGGINRGLTKKESYITMPTSLFKKRLKPAQIANLLDNDLEASVIERYPVIREIKDCLLARGAKGALMSGSGSSVFGLFVSRKQAETTYQELRVEARSGWSIFLAHTLTRPTD
jgi:4-diphosphocytidyl-2-C-methyl-D-erythritol kinase